MPAGELGRLVDAVVPDPEGPGVVVGLVGPDGALTSVARGMAALEHGVPIDERTVFHLASVSKQFTAEAVQVLIRAGKVGAGDRVAEYLPWLPFPEITVEQLARHSSGLRDLWQLVEASGRRMEDVITTADLVELIRRQASLQFEPGSWHAYSNTNYTLLALLVEAVSGETPDDFCREHLFAPLGMDDTLFVADHRKVVPRRAWSYRRIPSGYERIVLSYGTAGASSLHSTVTDLARWAAAVHSRDSWQSPLPSTPYAGTATYGWGIRHGLFADSPMLWHAGADAGFRTHLAMLSEQGWSVVVLGNFAEVDPDLLAHAALALAVPSPTVQPKPQLSAIVASGTYLDLGRGMVVDVESTDVGLRFDAGMGPTLLAPVGGRRFSDGYVVAEFSSAADSCVASSGVVGVKDALRLTSPVIGRRSASAITGRASPVGVDPGAGVMPRHCAATPPPPARRVVADGGVPCSGGRGVAAVAAPAVLAGHVVDRQERLGHPRQGLPRGAAREMYL